MPGITESEDTLVFMYDNNSDIFGFIYNGTEYYYIKNAQNDVIAIADAGGNIIANYYYDAWGKLVEATGNTEIAELNPIRYRSYYYDSETEWYYLNTRYYSADMCRFVNADGYVQTGQGILDKNMFAYCLNNPVNFKDNNGNSSSKSQEILEALAFIYVLTEMIKALQAPKTPVYICKKGEESKAPSGSVVVLDNRKKGSKKKNNFEVVKSHLISDKYIKRYICQEIIDYNEENPEDYEWNRDIDTMIVEWDWHNGFYKLRIKRDSSQSVNFDMGKGTDSTNPIVQMWGYITGED